MAKYLLYRIGANAANQSSERAPVAIVEAASRKEAEQVETQASPTVHDSAWAKLAPEVSVWVNQRLEAVPESRARAGDWNQVLVEEAAQ